MAVGSAIMRRILIDHARGKKRVKRGAAWYVDTKAGKQELLNRRIGRNEIYTEQSVLAYVDAQQEYYQRADVWPLSPQGEILVVIQIEDTQGIKNLPDMLKDVPGIGTVLIGVFSTAEGAGGVNGLLYGGGFGSLADQTLGVLVAVVFSGVLTTVIALAIKYTMGLRLDEEDEVNGIDLVAHGESAYDLHSGTSGGGSSVLAASTAPATTTTSKTEGASA